MHQARFYKIFSFVGNYRFVRKLNVRGFQNNLVFQYFFLSHVVAKRLASKENFKENNSNRPDIYFWRNYWRAVGHLEALRW